MYDDDYNDHFIAKAIASFVGVLLVIAFVVMLFGSPLVKTPADKIGLSYGGGPLEGAAYQKTVQPGSGLVVTGLWDPFYLYPTTQRDITVSSDGEDGDKDYGIPDVIRARTSDGVGCNVELAATFKLNTNNIRPFHETIGLKFKAWDDDGWGRMLSKNFLPPLERSVQEQCRQFTSDQIAKNPEIQAKMADGIADGLKTSINDLLGGDDFFCGPEFEVGQEKCPDFQVAVKSVKLPKAINESLEAQVNSANGLITAQNKAKSKEEEARGEALAAAASQQALTPEYLDFLRVQALQECAKNGNCTIISTNGDTGVNVNAGK